MPAPTNTATASPDVLQLQDIALRRGTQLLFDKLTLSLSERRIGFIGDNGAGKSSLFRLICGLEQPSAGQVHLPTAGADGARPVGMMFQNPDEQWIFPTVEEELALSLTGRGLRRQEALVQARQWLAARGLGHWAERAIASLSQGQRQHVCWLSLLIAAPAVLLLDEPFASLDLPGQQLLRQEIAQAPQQVLLSTHQLSHVRDFERVIWLEAGRVRADGPGTQVCAAYEAEVLQRAQERRLSIDEAAQATPAGKACA